MNSANPFSPRKPVDPRFFVGRETILEAIRKILETEKLSLVTDVEILGGRGMGKTSALLKIRSTAPQNCLAACLPGRSSTELEFIGELQLAVEREFRLRFDKPISFVHLFEAFKLAQESGTSVIIKTILEVKDSSVLIILDDADQVPLECLKMLKAAVYQLRSNHNIRAAIVLASRESVSEKLKKAGLSPSESLATQFQLKNFNDIEITSVASAI